MLEPAAWDALYLSPHLDDAVLSCGGQIEQQTRAGRRVLVVTLMTGDPPLEGLSPLACKLHQLWHFTAADVMVKRRVEDLDACRVVGAEAIHWDLLDAVYRRHPENGRWLYPKIRHVFGPPAAVDAAVVEEIVRRFGALPAAGRVFAPLGAGGHVDHRLTRRAAERVFGPRLVYYEDFPYARKRRALWKALLRGGGIPWSWRSEPVALDAPALARKCEAVARYPSQVATIFGGDEEMARQIRTFTRRRGGERLWYRNPPRQTR